jgi:undecaprenyl-diphosphatase
MGLIDNSHPEQWTAFMAVIQLGTLAAVLFYFSKELKTVPMAFFKENFNSSRKPFASQSADSRLGYMIAIGSIPIFTIGFALKKIIEGSLTKELPIIAGSLILLAIVLYIAEKVSSLKKNTDSMTIKDSIIIGLVQCLALIPGSSRSGTTITAGLFVGLNRETAARYSFLLSIPAVLVSGLYQLAKSYKHLSGADSIALIIATAFAAVSGYYAIAFMINFLKTRTNLIFIIYRIVIGFVLIFMIYKGIV